MMFLIFWIILDFFIPLLQPTDSPNKNNTFRLHVISATRVLEGKFLHNITVVYFYQQLGAAHFKCCQNLLFHCFSCQKAEKGRKSKKIEAKRRKTCVFWVCTRTLVEDFIHARSWSTHAIFQQPHKASKLNGKILAPKKLFQVTKIKQGCENYVTKT